MIAAVASACVAGLAAETSVSDLADVADVSRRLGFSAGDRPLVVRAPNQGSLSARACAASHQAVYDDWQTTRHRVAWDNVVFLDGLGRELLPRCVHYHAPLLEQQREVGPLRGRRFTSPSTTGLLHEGITCAVCHVRDGRVLTTRPVTPDAATPMHPITVDKALQDPAFCASCHQFGFSNSDVLMQGIWSEWRAFHDGGGQGTCQSCHMPGGRHLFRGAWDHDLLRRSLQVTVTKAQVPELRSVDVGHHFPTGDLFRHLTVEVAANDNDFVDVARIGRVFGGVGVAKHVVEDTSLVPSVPCVVSLPANRTRWRVRYHYAEARHEDAGAVDAVVIAEGTIR